MPEAQCVSYCIAAVTLYMVFSRRAALAFAPAILFASMPRVLLVMSGVRLVDMAVQHTASHCHGCAVHQQQVCALQADCPSRGGEEAECAALCAH